MLNLANCILVAATSATVNPRTIVYQDFRAVQSGPKSYTYYCGDNLPKSVQTLIINVRPSGMREYLTAKQGEIK